MHIWLDVIHRKIITDVPVEITVLGICRIAFLGRPYQACQMLIPDKAVKSVGTFDGAVAAALGLIRRKGKSLGSETDPADVMSSENTLDSGIITAFGEPETIGHLVEVSVMLHHACLDLCIHCNRIILVDGKICVRSRGCNQLKATGIGKSIECRKEVALAFILVE